VGRGGAAHRLFSEEQVMSTQTLIDTENMLVFVCCTEGYSKNVSCVRQISPEFS